MFRLFKIQRFLSQYETNKLQTMSLDNKPDLSSMKSLFNTVSIERRKLNQIGYEATQVLLCKQFHAKKEY